jgi:hypothetical protein
MKSMLYVGATLMIGASIYGFVDYKQTHNKKEFKEMYAEKKAVDAPVVAREEVTVPVAEKKATVKTKAVTNKKKGAKEDELVVIAPIAAEDKLLTEKTSLTKEPAVAVAPAEESSVLKTVKKKKKVRKEYFSRGRIEEDDIKVVAPKKEVKKIESKEL